WLLAHHEEHERRAVIIWGTLAVFGVGSALMVSLGRLDKFGIGGATAPWYLDIALLFWFAVMALLALVMTHPRRAHALATVNVLALAVGLPFYSYASAQAVWFRGGSVAGLEIQEECFFQFPRTGDSSCLIGTLVRPERTHQLAIYGLSLFADRSYETVIPSRYVDYQVESTPSRILIEAASTWYTTAIERLFLSDDRPIIHVVPDDAESVLGANRQPGVNVVNQAIASDSWWRFWYVQQIGQPSTLQIPAAYAMLYRGDFAFAGEMFEVRGYQQISPLIERQPLTFQSVKLETWLVTASPIRPGGSVRLTSFWNTTEQLSADYHLTFVMADESGVGIARADGALGVPPTQWETDQTYADVRSFTVPEDVAPGAYPLLVGLYDPETLESFGGLAYLTDVTVE
ncbi:MAG: hypothetical protein AAF125_19435, partial [Chloroflexota bacterium]